MDLPDWIKLSLTSVIEENHDKPKPLVKSILCGGCLDKGERIHFRPDIEVFKLDDVPVNS